MFLFWVCSSFSCCPEFFHLPQKDWAVSSIWFLCLALFNLLHVSPNSWAGAFKLSPNMSMHHFQQIFDLNGIRGRDILEATEENNEGAIRHFIRSDVNSVQKTDKHGRSLKDVAWSSWSFGDAMTWCNGMQWPWVISFHFVVPWFGLKVEFLWALW